MHASLIMCALWQCHTVLSCRHSHATTSDTYPAADYWWLNKNQNFATKKFHEPVLPALGSIVFLKINKDGKEYISGDARVVETPIPKLKEKLKAAEKAARQTSHTSLQNDVSDEITKLKEKIESLDPDYSITKLKNDLDEANKKKFASISELTLKLKREKENQGKFLYLEYIYGGTRCVHLVTPNKIRNKVMAINYQYNKTIAYKAEYRDYEVWGICHYATSGPWWSTPVAAVATFLPFRLTPERWHPYLLLVNPNTNTAVIRKIITTKANERAILISKGKDNMINEGLKELATLKNKTVKTAENEDMIAMMEDAIRIEKEGAPINDWKSVLEEASWSVVPEASRKKWKDLKEILPKGGCPLKNTWCDQTKKTALENSSTPEKKLVAKGRKMGFWCQETTRRLYLALGIEENNISDWFFYYSSNKDNYKRRWWSGMTWAASFLGFKHTEWRKPVDRLKDVVKRKTSEWRDL